MVFFVTQFPKPIITQHWEDLPPAMLSRAGPTVNGGLRDQWGQGGWSSRWGQHHLPSVTYHLQTFYQLMCFVLSLFHETRKREVAWCKSDSTGLISNSPGGQAQLGHCLTSCLTWSCPIWKRTDCTCLKACWKQKWGNICRVPGRLRPRQIEFYSPCVHHGSWEHYSAKEQPVWFVHLFR